MAKFTIYHNPRCSKSRQTLALLEQADVDVAIIKYLDTPPTAEELVAILGKLGMSARELLRTGEEEYKSLGLADTNLDDKALVAAMVEHPRLMQRPIVVKDDQAVLGRPPENVQELIA